MVSVHSISFAVNRHDRYPYMGSGYFYSMIIAQEVNGKEE